MMMMMMMIIIIIIASSNHRLESAGLNALQELLFKMLGMGGENSNGYLWKKAWQKIGVTFDSHHGPSSG